jgi:hypothetical protein
MSDIGHQEEWLIGECSVGANTPLFVAHTKEAQTRIKIGRKVESRRMRNEKRWDAAEGIPSRLATSVLSYCIDGTPDL